MAGGYTGCHLYKITATSSQNVAHASVTLADLQTTATKKKLLLLIIKIGNMFYIKVQMVMLIL